MNEIKPMNEATKKEFDELTYLTSLKGKLNPGDLDKIQLMWNTFVSTNNICRSCPSQLHSIMSILKLRYNENKGFLYNKFYNNTPKCERCSTEYVKKYHFDKYCPTCSEQRKQERKYKPKSVENTEEE